ncbi:hypothetical protein [Variovorax paradoxus]|nr:hypothetical protein [Variovorax paradoxus]
MKPRKLVLAPKAVRPKHKQANRSEERSHRACDAAPRSARIHLLS